MTIAQDLFRCCTFLVAILSAVVDSQSLDDVPAVISANESFSTLFAALSVSGLNAPLSAPMGPYTLFAPTDEAFESLPDAEVLIPCLFLPENSVFLRTILSYHVVGGFAIEKSVFNDGQVIGSGLRVNEDGSNVLINDAKIILPDITASNGVVHGIDKGKFFFLGKM